MRIFLLGSLVLLLCGMAVALDLSTSYATEVVLRDCAGRSVSLLNRTEFSSFIGKPVDSGNIGAILTTARSLSKTEPDAQSQQLRYFACGDYLMTGQAGRLYWRGVELALPAYMVDLQSRLNSAEDSQSASVARIAALEQDNVTLRSKLSDVNAYLSLFVVGTLFLVVLMAFNKIRERAHHAGRIHHFRQLALSHHHKAGLKKK